MCVCSVFNRISYIFYKLEIVFYNLKNITLTFDLKTVAKLLVGGAEFLFISVVGMVGSGAGTTTGTGMGIVAATGIELFNMPVCQTYKLYQ